MEMVLPGAGVLAERAPQDLEPLPAHVQIHRGVRLMLLQVQPVTPVFVFPKIYATNKIQLIYINIIHYKLAI